VQNSLCIQVLCSPVLTALLHGTGAMGVSQTLLHGTRNGITDSACQSASQNTGLIGLIFVTAKVRISGLTNNTSLCKTVTRRTERVKQPSCLQLHQIITNFNNIVSPATQQQIRSEVITE